MFYVQFLDRQGHSRCGSRHQAIFRNLKTLRGAKNRTAKHFTWPEFSDYRIYKVADTTALYRLDTENAAPLLTVKF